jgi:putative oxidoreductase
MKYSDFSQAWTKFTSGFQDLGLLFIRLVLVYGFYGPAIKKIQNFPSIVEWFKNTLNLPFPELNAYLATGTETLGFIFLLLGFKTRLISVPLMIMMIVAMTVVHGFEKFACAENGFEIALYYFIMLFVLMSFGAGKYSLDETLFKKFFGKN